MDLQSYRIIAISDKSSDMLANLCSKLAESDCRINSISSLRLGHSYVVVLMLKTQLEKAALEDTLASVVESHEVHLIVSQNENKKYTFVKSDAFIRVKGQPQNGMNARIISLLTDAGLDIHGLESDTYEVKEKEVFTINIKGKALNGIEDLTDVAVNLQQEGLDIAVSTDWSLLI